MKASNGRTKEVLIAVGLGVAFMVLALIPQIITQELPSIFIILKYGIVAGETVLESFEFSRPLVYSLFIGGTAAGYQELMKYFAVGNSKNYLAAWVGLGFALVDVAVLVVEVAPRLPVPVPLLLVALSGVNILSSLLFHPGTAMILKYGRSVGKGGYFLLFTILLHGIIDGGLVFTDIFVIKNSGLYFQATTVFWVTVMVISIASFLTGRRYMTKIALIDKDQQSFGDSPPT
jgi:hypothetical protein